MPIQDIKEVKALCRSKIAGTGLSILAFARKHEEFLGTKPEIISSLLSDGGNTSLPALNRVLLFFGLEAKSQIKNVRTTTYEVVEKAPAHPQD
jgi:hypothetical protein